MNLRYGLPVILLLSTAVLAGDVQDMYKAVLQSCRKDRTAQARSQLDAMKRKYPADILTRKAELAVIESSRDYFDMVVGLKLFLKNNPSWDGTDQILFRIAGLYSLHNNYSEALSTYRDIVSNHPASPLAGPARLLSGNILMSRTDFDAAERMLLPLTAATNPLLRDTAGLRLADISFYKKQYITSASNYARLVLNPATDPEVRLEALFFLGESMAGLGKKYEAAGHFRGILLDYPDSEYARLSRERLSDIGYPEKNAIKPGRSKSSPEGVARKYVQAGAFRDIRTANTLRLRLKSDGFDVALKRQAEKDGYLYRVLAGPYRDQSEAMDNAAKIRSKYGCDAFCVTERE
jgi:outer membrane protein assembly factor BamD (BamD/ComL family)